jgi:hypothetical protein
VEENLKNYGLCSRKSKIINDKVGKPTALKTLKPQIILKKLVKSGVLVKFGKA